MGRLTAICQSGLGNRISTFIGGCFLAHKLNYDFDVVWPIDTTRDFRFDDLFTGCGHLVRSNYNITDYEVAIKPLIQSKTTLKNFLSFKNNLNVIPTEAVTVNMCRQYKNILYKSSLLPSEVADDVIPYFLKKLKVQPNIIKDVLEFINNNDINDITNGYHFRHAKHECVTLTEKNTIFNSIKNSKKKCFICSDTKETESYFKQLPNICTFNKTHYPVFSEHNNKILHNISRDSAVEAFKDVLVLSRTNIQNSYLHTSSTFLKLAYWYKNISIGQLKGSKIFFSEII